MNDNAYKFDYAPTPTSDLVPGGPWASLWSDLTPFERYAVLRLFSPDSGIPTAVAWRAFRELQEKLRARRDGSLDANLLLGLP
jgi:hypothetical protein